MPSREIPFIFPELSNFFDCRISLSLINSLDFQNEKKKNIHDDFYKCLGFTIITIRGKLCELSKAYSKNE